MVENYEYFDNYHFELQCAIQSIVFMYKLKCSCSNILGLLLSNKRCRFFCCLDVNNTSTNIQLKPIMFTMIKSLILINQRNTVTDGNIICFLFVASVIPFTILIPLILVNSRHVVDIPCTIHTIPNIFVIHITHYPM